MTTRLGLIDSLPELFVALRRDGRLLCHVGGRGMESLVPPEGAEGQSVESFWPAGLAGLVKRLARRAVELRSTLDAEIHESADYEVRVSAQGPDRALCVIRQACATHAVGRSQDADDRASHLDRRGFLRRLKDSIAAGSLNERPLALSVIQIDGLIDLVRIIDSKVVESVINEALRRLPVGDSQAGSAARCYVGQLAENLLVAVIETADRAQIETQIAMLCASLRQPIQLGDAHFHLRPHAGVAIMGRDAASGDNLLDHARTTAIEARRAGNEMLFFSDTLQLRSLARLDVARELQEALSAGEIQLRYVERHDLSSGELRAWMGYLKWHHPFRGDVRPAEFLRVAEATGLGLTLSRAMLMQLGEDFPRFKLSVNEAVRISFGAPRHHVLSASFFEDVEAFLRDYSVPAERLELRIAERAYLARDPEMWRALSERGIQLVVDEFGRDVSSLELLARSPIAAIQLDRAWVTAAAQDRTAARICQAAISIAASLEIKSIAPGIDSEERRLQLAGMGCHEGLGDLFAPIAMPARQELMDVVQGAHRKRTVCAD